MIYIVVHVDEDGTQIVQPFKHRPFAVDFVVRQMQAQGYEQWDHYPKLDDTCIEQWVVGGGLGMGGGDFCIL